MVGRGGTIGLMQIKLATARGIGYSGDAAGLRDPDTNLTYGVKYLAGAWRAANGDHDRAVRYYAERLLLCGQTAAADRERRAVPQCTDAERQSRLRLPLNRRKFWPAAGSRTRRRQGGGSRTPRYCRCKQRQAALTRPAIGLH